MFGLFRNIDGAWSLACRYVRNPKKHTKELQTAIAELKKRKSDVGLLYFKAVADGIKQINGYLPVLYVIILCLFFFSSVKPNKVEKSHYFCIFFIFLYLQHLFYFNHLFFGTLIKKKN